MAREPNVALSITASGAFVAKHKLPHIKEKNLHTQNFKSEDPFFRDHCFLGRKSRNQSQIEDEDFFF